VTIVSSETHSGDYAAQLHYSQGNQDAGWNWKRYLPTDGYSPDTPIYISWYQKWQEGWQWCPITDQKLVMLYGLDPPDEWRQTANWGIHVHTVSNSELVLEHYIGDGSGGSQTFYQNVGTPYALKDDKWKPIEIRAQHVNR